MSRIVAIGSELALAGYALVGVEVKRADEPSAARRAWDELDADVGLLLLTHEAAIALPDPAGPDGPLCVVLPG